MMFRSIDDGIVNPFALACSALFLVARVVSSREGGIGLFSCNVSTGGALLDVFGGVFFGEVGLMGLGGFGLFGFFS